MRKRKSSTFVKFFMTLLTTYAVVSSIGVARGDQVDRATIHVGSDKLSIAFKRGHLLITESYPPSRWGFERGDIIFQADDIMPQVPEDLFQKLRSAPDGGNLRVKVRRAGIFKFIKINKSNYKNIIPPTPPPPPPSRAN